MGAVLKRVLKKDPTLAPPTTETGLGKWNDLSGLLLPESEEQRLIDDIKDGTMETVHDILERFNDINEHFREYQWTWTYRVILDYYGLETVTLDDAERIKEDYVKARRAWIAEIRKDAEKEYSLGDVDEEVLTNFISQLDREVDFEN